MKGGDYFTYDKIMDTANQKDHVSVGIKVKKF
jgi:hypothetical protein